MVVGTYNSLEAYLASRDNPDSPIPSVPLRGSHDRSWLRTEQNRLHQICKKLDITLTHFKDPYGKNYKITKEVADLFNYLFDQFIDKDERSPEEHLPKEHPNITNIEVYLLLFNALLSLNIEDDIIQQQLLCFNQKVGSFQDRIVSQSVPLILWAIQAWDEKYYLSKDKRHILANRLSSQFIQNYLLPFVSSIESCLIDATENPDFFNFITVRQSPRED